MPSFLWILLVAIVGIYIWENHVIEVVEIEVPIKGLAADLEGMKIAHLSDLHGRRLNTRWVEKRLLGAGIDIIALTGDYVRGRDESSVERLEPLLEVLPQIAPTYAVNGNHDQAAGWPEIRARLEGQGIYVLDNTYTSIQRGTARLVLAGLAYPYNSVDNLRSALPTTNETIVLLTHSPQVFRQEQPLMRRADRALWEELMQRPALTLVGHTHGGQIKIPLLGAVTTASGRLFPREHIQGLSWEGAGWLYISRGIGYTGLPLRFLSRPEIAIITLKPAE
ncbi:MAG: hypothetical protein GX033_10435 [Firmicutes bacterium]|nr:hypothetical protein [Bacillota bacterium]